MSDIVHVSALFTLPQDVFERLGGTTNREEATWECKRCGVVAPQALTNGFLPAKCACKLAASRFAREEKIRYQIQAEMVQRREARCAKCYCWLPTEDLRDCFEHWTFETYHTSVRYIKAYQEIQRFVQADSVEWTNYLVVGPPGTGKTRLLVTALNELTKSLVLCRFLTANALFETISRCIATEQDYTRYLEEMTNCDVLLIDDLDKVHIRIPGEENFQVKTLYSVINGRYLKRKPTWITSNMPDIARYVGEPAFDRLSQHGVQIQMDGPSFRRSLFRVL
jgi:DNA replication protein DnaC